MSPAAIPPPITWAQRQDLLYIVIEVECKDIDYKFTENQLNFKGVNSLETSKQYEVTLNFLNPIDPEKVSVKNNGRCMEFTIAKATSGPYWPTLTNDKTKLNFLKINFAKWRDESDDEADDVDMGQGFNQFNTGNLNWDDLNQNSDADEEGDDSDDEIPSLAPVKEDEPKAETA